MKIISEDNTLYLSDNDLVCSFDKITGMLVNLSNGNSEVLFSGLKVDIGCEGKYLLENLEFDNMLEKHTWDLPGIIPLKSGKDPKFKGFIEEYDKLIAVYHIIPLEVKIVYSFEAGTLKAYSLVKNLSKDRLWINGLAFITSVPADLKFDFPSNTPCYDNMNSSELSPYSAVTTGLINACIHTQSEGVHFNLAFIDPVEKWGCGVYKTEKDTNLVYVPNLEVMLGENEEVECGYLYFQLPGNENPYTQISDLYEGLGYKIAKDGIREGIMYSGHPSGTLDKNFPLKLTMREYADNLDELKEIGIDHVWLLPLFDHGEENVYHSTDQSIIDKRYGSDEDVKYYCDKAHSLGMTILFDYVPHGPSPDFPLAKNNPDWCSKRQDGSLHDEWNCVSFDYNHPGYLDYTRELAYDHVKRFGIDGARIDCAMGGLSNWRPYGNNRPSSNSVQSGVNISRVIREGLIKGGKKPLNMPENFNPVPCYFPETDVFYGMNLYRVFCELDNIIHTDTAKYTKLLTSWLEREYWTTPKGYTKLRFLGNHDTVSWVWQSARAVDYYGLGTAKALWAAISLIDGMVMIYQGDEDPKWYLDDKSQVLKDYFKKLFSDRKNFINDDMEIRYIYAGNSIMAFERFNNSKRRLILVNLGKEEAKIDETLSGTKTKDLLAGDAQISSGEIVIKGYEYAIFDM